jgi:HK97 gp10 family phage protein
MSKLDRSNLIKKGKVSIGGLDALLQTFKDLTGGKSDTKLVSAMRYALQPLQKQVKANAPRQRSNKNKQGRLGLLRKSIGLKTKKYGRGVKKRIVGFVGPKISTIFVKGKFISKPHKYAHLVERGATSHAIKPRKLERLNTFMGPLKEGSKKQVTLSSYRHPGATKKPFMKPALAAVGSQIFNRFGEKMIEIIQQSGGRK